MNLNAISHCCQHGQQCGVQDLGDRVKHCIMSSCRIRFDDVIEGRWELSISRRVLLAKSNSRL